MTGFQYVNGGRHRPRRGIRPGERSFVAVCGLQSWITDACQVEFLTGQGFPWSLAVEVLREAHRSARRCEQCSFRPGRAEP